MTEMWNVEGYGIVGVGDVRNVGCWGCGMLIYKTAIDTDYLRPAKYDSNHCWVIHVFHNKMIYATECYDLQ